VFAVHNLTPKLINRKAIASLYTPMTPSAYVSSSLMQLSELQPAGLSSEARAKTTDCNLITCALDFNHFIQHVIGFENIFWTTVTRSIIKNAC